MTGKNGINCVFWQKGPQDVVFGGKTANFSEKSGKKPLTFRRPFVYNVACVLWKGVFLPFFGGSRPEKAGCMENRSPERRTVVGPGKPV